MLNNLKKTFNPKSIAVKPFLMKTVSESQLIDDGASQNGGDDDDDDDDEHDDDDAADNYDKFVDDDDECDVDGDEHHL